VPCVCNARWRSCLGTSGPIPRWGPTLGRAEVATMLEEERPLDPRAQELVELARDSLRQLTEGRRVAGLHALRARLSSRQRIQSVRHATLGVTGALVLAVCVVPTVSSVRHRGEVASPLTLHVESADLRADGTVEGSGSARPVLRFSDGSDVSLNQGARVRVRSTDEHGARITLEQGEAHVYVVHAQGTHWTFEAEARAGSIEPLAGVQRSEPVALSSGAAAARAVTGGR